MREAIVLPRSRERCARAVANPTDFTLHAQVLVYVQRVARMLKNHRADLPLTTAVFLQYLARELADEPEGPDWLVMLTMALELRSLVVGACFSTFHPLPSHSDQQTFVCACVLHSLGRRR